MKGEIDNIIDNLFFLRERLHNIELGVDESFNRQFAVSFITSFFAFVCFKVFENVLYMNKYDDDEFEEVESDSDSEDEQDEIVSDSSSSGISESEIIEQHSLLKD